MDQQPHGPAGVPRSVCMHGRAQVESMLRGESGLASVRSSRLYLVDLAGARRAAPVAQLAVGHVRALKLLFASAIFYTICLHYG